MYPPWCGSQEKKEPPEAARKALIYKAFYQVDPLVPQMPKWSDQPKL